MALKLKYKDEHGVLSIDVSPGSSPPRAAPPPPPPRDQLAGPKFDTINSRFGRCDLFGGKYDGGEAPRSLFRSRYNSVEEELANTPYAFAAERSLRAAGPRLQLELHQPRADFADYGEHRFCTSDSSLFGPRVDLARTSDEEETPAFTVTQLIHAQDRYYDLSSRQSCDSPAAKPLGRTVRAVADSYEVRSAPASARKPSTRGDGDAAADAFRVLPGDSLRSAQPASANLPVVPTSKRKREKSFAIIAEPVISRPSSPRSLPVDIRPGAGRVSPFKGRGFREETSRHNTPKTSAANSRSCSPSKKRSSSQANSDKMAQVATIPPTSILSRPRSPRNFLRENMKEVKELSELNREKHEAEAEVKRQQEEEALLKEMGLLDKPTTRSRTGSRTNSRSNSPSKINLRSRSNSPSAILQFESMPKAKVSNELTTPTGRKQKPTTHRSRVSSVSKSQPQSNDGSPKTSKIPKRQNSVSPASNKRNFISYRRPFDNTLNKNQRFISNSTSSIHETIRIGSQVHDKRAISQSDQFLDISPNNILSKPPISPGRGGPPPSNRSISTKRLSPIVGTPNKSLDDLKSSSTKTTPRPSPAARKSIKTAGTAPSTSRVIPRQSNKTASRDPSPDKKGLSKVTVNSKISQNKNLSKISNSKPTQNLPLGNKTDQKKSISRTNSVKSLTSTQSTKNINEKNSLMKTKDKKNELNDKTKSNNKVQKTGVIKTSNDNLKPANTKDESAVAQQETTTNDFDTKDEVDKSKQDNETQYDKITNEKGDLVILTKKNVVSMTTAAITAQPLEVVTTVTNQLPAALEKAREKGIFERLGSKDSLAPKEEGKEEHMVNIETNKQTTINGFTELKDITVTKEEKNGRHDDKKPPKTTKTLYGDESVKLKLLQPPYNNPQVERVKQKIDSILKEPEISTENILTSVKKIEERVKEDVVKNIFPKTKPELLDTKIKSEFNVNDIKDEVEKENEKISAEIRSEATKIIDSIITPVEEPIGVADKHKEATKENIEPIVMVVNEKSKIEPKRTDIVKVNQNLVKGDAEVEVQSSNVSTPGVEKITLATTAAGGSVSDKSATSNGGFPQSTSTTPKPPPRIQRQAKMETQSPQPDGEKESPPADKKPNICSRLMGKCKTKCCSCCAKPKEDDEQTQTEAKDMTKEVTEESVDVKKEQRKGVFSKLNCFKKKEAQKEEAVAEMGAGKAATIEFESERKHKRKLRDVVCAWCRRGRVRDSAGPLPARRVADVAGVDVSSPTVTTAGCCGGRRRDVQRRDSILSDSAQNTCCNYRLCQWVRGACRRKSEPASSPRTSLFSKNKSLSPTLPPEDTRTKLDPSLVEHTSVMRGAIPVLPISLAYFCLFCNILVPGLGTIFSGLFCLCFGIPRFGIHDSPRHRIGSFVINLLVGCGQLFTVLFCLVGWGWSIWWGTIMVRTSRKYRKLKAEASLEEAEAAPPVTTNNHTRT